ncbi:hypothetical protein DPMN_186230 [Dreissena polymorpha]|uniref:Uncharacterized protein n=1 Tax=Dreissena polymorpha TaxID=45954 RepID=A0A9D4I6C6_DREPO|nr:hypothetical protein DPMN_186230 [Dreissena polymorpha]
MFYKQVLLGWSSGPRRAGRATELARPERWVDSRRTRANGGFCQESLMVGVVSRTYSGY